MITRSVRNGLRAAVAALLIVPSIGAAKQVDEAKEILDESGVKGGLVVHLGSDDGALTAALRANDSYLVQGLDTDAEDVAKARETIRKQGLYGTVSVDRFDGKSLPYIDNFVNLIVAEESGQIEREELLRALCPGGVALVRQGDSWEKIVKPRPGDIDDWTHYLHDASGNAVAHDTVVGPPRHLQWVGNPRWSRHHDRMASMSALVSDDGRLFMIADEGSRISIELPAKWALIARDAFNGTVLWKVPIEKWQDHMWPLKSGPTQLARRLVAEEGRVYATLALEAPLTCLDAASGEIIRTYEGTSTTEEVILVDGTLYLVVKQRPSELVDYAPKFNVGDQAARCRGISLGRVAEDDHGR